MSNMSVWHRTKRLFTQRELLLKIIYELEAKNSLLVVNNSLLKYKISTLEDKIQMKDAKIDKMKKKLPYDTKIDKKHTVAVTAEVFKAVCFE